MLMDIVAGPPGSGKSTFFPVQDRGFDHFNIDDRRRELNAGCSQRIPAQIRDRAKTEYEEFIRTHIAAGTSFSFEATLAQEITFDQALQAKDRGFQIWLTFVAADLEECVERVLARYEAGGHGLIPPRLHEVYRHAMGNLARAIRLFDIVQVYDNSVRGRLNVELYEAKPCLVLSAQQGTLTSLVSSPPAWLRAALANSEYDLD